MKKHNVINFTLFFINPVLGFLGSLSAFLRNKNACLTFSLSSALILIYFPIMWDTAVNFYGAYYGGTNGWLYPYTFVPAYFMEKFGVDFYFFIFFSVFFIIYTWSKIVYDTFLELDIKNKTIISVIFLLFVFNYSDIMDIIRTALSFSIFFYYVLLVKNKNLPNFLFFLLFSIWMHAAASILFLLYFVSKLNFFSRKLNLTFLFLSLILGLLLPFFGDFFSSFIKSIPLIGDKIFLFMFGSIWGAIEYSASSILIKFFKVFFVFFICLITILNMYKDPVRKHQYQLMLLIGFSFLLFSGFVTLSERLNLAFSFIFLIFLRLNVTSLYAKIAISFVLFRTIGSYLLVYSTVFFGNHDIYYDNEKKSEIMMKPFYYPTIILMDVRDYGNSDRFLFDNITRGKYTVE